MIVEVAVDVKVVVMLSCCQISRGGCRVAIVVSGVALDSSLAYVYFFK